MLCTQSKKYANFANLVSICNKMYFPKTVMQNDVLLSNKWFTKHLISKLHILYAHVRKVVTLHILICLGLSDLFLLMLRLPF